MDINELLTYLLTPIAQVALIMAIAELVKKAGLKNNFIPLVDLALGLLLGGLVYGVYMHMHPVECFLIGLALGLSACGTFSGIKNLIEAKED